MSGAIQSAAIDRLWSLDAAEEAFIARQIQQLYEESYGSRLFRAVFLEPAPNCRCVAAPFRSAAEDS